MEEMSKKPLQSYFEAIEDPRVERTKQHKLMNIIITLHKTYQSEMESVFEKIVCCCDPRTVM